MTTKTVLAAEWATSLTADEALALTTDVFAAEEAAERLNSWLSPSDDDTEV